MEIEWSDPPPSRNGTYPIDDFINELRYQAKAGTRKWAKFPVAIRNLATVTGWKARFQDIEFRTHQPDKNTSRPYKNVTLYARVKDQR